MKPTTRELTEAVSELGAIPYFPAGSGPQLAIMRQLERFVSGAHELLWLIDTAVGAMREWKGIPELRGLYCTRFKPADGVEANCSVDGFTSEDSEMRHELDNAKLQLPELPRGEKGMQQLRQLVTPEVRTDAKGSIQ